MLYKNILNMQRCYNCKIRNTCFLRCMPLQNYPGEIQNFMIQIPSKAYQYRDGEQRWHADYHAIQGKIVEYYNSYDCYILGNENYALTNEAQKDSDRQFIIKQFKDFLEVAANATENKNPELSIMFDGIGLILASDFLEVISKVFSIMKTIKKCYNFNEVYCSL